MARALSVDEGLESCQVRLVLRRPVEAEREEPTSPAPQVASVGDVVLGRSDAARERAYRAKASKQLLVGTGKSRGQPLHRLRALARQGRGPPVHPLPRGSGQLRAPSLGAVR